MTSIRLTDEDHQLIRDMEYADENGTHASSSDLKQLDTLLHKMLGLYSRLNKRKENF